jgi:hypothetical protein
METGELKLENGEKRKIPTRVAHEWAPGYPLTYQEWPTAHIYDHSDLIERFDSGMNIPPETKLTRSAPECARYGVWFFRDFTLISKSALQPINDKRHFASSIRRHL